MALANFECIIESWQIVKIHLQFGSAILQGQSCFKGKKLDLRRFFSELLTNNSKFIYLVEKQKPYSHLLEMVIENSPNSLLQNSHLYGLLFVCDILCSASAHD
jgi:hypothetical protein